MLRKRTARSWVAGMFVAVSWAGASRAQVASGYRPQVPATTSIFSNPTLNPYLNPYAVALAPQANNPDYLLYLNAANQANGGIGTGVISGTRIAPGVPAGKKPPTASAAPNRSGTFSSAMPRGRSVTPGRTEGAMPVPGTNGAATMSTPAATATPWANASGYFLRGPGGGDGANRYYNRAASPRVATSPR